jgi:hypothetical protein
MQQLAPFPDAEKVVMTLLAGVAPTVVTSFPAQISGAAVRVNRVGGVDDFFTDYPRIEVVLLYPVTQSGDTDAAWALFGQIVQVVVAARCTTVAGALIDQAETFNPPQQLPYENQNIRRIVATFQLAFRRPRS